MLYFSLAIRSRRFYGLALPSGLGSLALLPLALGLGVAGGAAVVPAALDAEVGLVFYALPLSLELLMRGVGHGVLATTFQVQQRGGQWFLSIPTAATAAAMALIVAAVHAPVAAVAPGGFVLRVAAAGVLGLLCGMARERSESVLLPVLFHLVAAAAGLVIGVAW